ncbi:MAG: outer membrane protein OmpA-like peptidoglycan-associated protein [Pseudomonadales bacterium]
MSLFHHKKVFPPSCNEFVETTTTNLLKPEAIKMKKLLKNRLAVSAVITMTAFTGVSNAVAETSGMTEAKMGTAFVSAAVSGAILGGPVGFVVGALAGVYVGEKIEDGEQLAVVSNQLVTTENEIALLSRQLTMVQKSNQQYAQLVMEQLEFDMLFKTNQSQLSAAGVKRLQSLGGFLASNPGIAIRLDGYADPRGNAGDNRELSQQRLAAVEEVLHAQGVGKQRINSLNHGASQSVATAGDVDAYAFERKVTMQLETDNNASAVASAQ